jgi:transposase
MDFMGKVTRKRHTAEFKARVALEAIKGEQTLAEIGAKHGIHLTLVGVWKKAAIEERWVRHIGRLSHKQ